MRADEARRQRHGPRTTFVRVADVPADPQAPPSWPARPQIRIVGTPSSRSAAVERVAEVAARANGVPVSAFSLADLEQLAAREDVTLRSMLEELQAAGLELVAEAPFDRLQRARRSIEEVNIAGLGLARLTIHQLPSSDVPGSLLTRIARLQHAVAVIRAFAPLPRHVNPAVPTTGFDDVKRVALARLIVDNVPSIQVDWALYGSKLAQVALTVGADDVDGVSADRRHERGPPPRAARGDPPQHPRRRPGAGGAQRAVRCAGPMSRDPIEPAGRRRCAWAPSATSTRARSSSAWIARRVSRSGSTCLRGAPGCCTKAPSMSA